MGCCGIYFFSLPFAQVEQSLCCFPIVRSPPEAIKGSVNCPKYTNLGTIAERQGRESGWGRQSKSESCYGYFCTNLMSSFLSETIRRKMKISSRRVSKIGEPWLCNT